jgi:ABC-type multidrug transport system fused ATPase/permease subunit
VIAHRLGTIRHADNIVVLKHGIVAEQGTHEELLEKEDGIYCKMWNMQLHSTTNAGSQASLALSMDEDK